VISARRLPALTSLVALAAAYGVSKRRLGERNVLERSDAMKTTILRAVSHDLRSPLTAILASATALMQADLSLDHQDRRGLVDTIVEEAERLERLVSNLLDLSRLQAGAADSAQSIRSVDDIQVQTLAAMGGVTARVDVSLPEEGPPAVRVDAHQIERVLSNLLENALRHSPASEDVRVRVRETGSEVLVRVIDQGPGIAANDRQRIFEPFCGGSHGQNGRGGRSWPCDRARLRRGEWLPPMGGVARRARHGVRIGAATCRITRPGAVGLVKPPHGLDLHAAMQFKTMQGFSATAHQQLLVMFVRASKQGDPILAWISTRRLVSLRVNLNG
jgi:Histidine kinase-, DNA gyrase B-, and HSP90-like ATPase/His Kinase A (phospho-acceptor) domain